MLRFLLSIVLLGCPAVAQLNYQQSQKLYDKAAAAVGREAAAVVEKLRSGREWNRTDNVYELLRLAQANPAPEARAAAARLDEQLRGLLAGAERRLRNPDRDNLARYAEANRQLAATEAGDPRVVFLGDSITDGWKLAEYFRDKPFVNRGISGQITGEMLGRMKADVIDHKPAAMLVLAGANDLARGVEVRVIRNNLWMIGELAAASGIRVIFASVLPVSDYAKDRPPQTPLRPPEKIREINSWLQQHCRNRGFTYLDYHSAMADDTGWLKAELANDGLHPNAAGYEVMAPLALTAIEKTLRGR